MNGLVRDQTNNEPLMAVNIYASDQFGNQVGTRGTTTDQNGKFVAEFDAQFLTFRYLGFRPITIPQRPGFVIIDMLPTAYDLPGVVIKPENNVPWWIYLIGAYGLYKSLK